MSRRNGTGADRRPGFVILYDEELFDPDLSAHAKVLLLALKSYWGPGNPPWVSRETLATRLGWSLARVKRAFRELRAAGLLTSEWRRGRHVWLLGDTDTLLRDEQEPPDAPWLEDLPQFEEVPL